MRLRFTMRDLLWLTLMVAMGVGWWIDRQSLILRNKFTIMTTDGVQTDELPVVLKDNHTGNVLVTDRDKWRVGQLVPDSAPAAQTPSDK